VARSGRAFPDFRRRCILPLDRTKRSWTKSSLETFSFKNAKKRAIVVINNDGTRPKAPFPISNPKTLRVRTLQEQDPTCRNSQIPSTDWLKVRHSAVSSRNCFARLICVSPLFVPRWETDFQHIVFKGQGQDTGTRSASVSIQGLVILSTPACVLLIGM